MTTIYYENWPVAHLADQDGLSLTYNAAWEQRASAFPLSLTMPLRTRGHGGPHRRPSRISVMRPTPISKR
ncbi:HipA N-terminal domain-containing protein (plasmid) [Aliirhizobium terrae]|uniref:HipA N-terminal domain-containing protein n=1 Tax=Terrirhizobium terrae TaxID=2926709 RepID=UPI002577F794|nr:HipA N-terminal domain-containing protein [Rhizobium sp. CC-CFT758]WJH38545.1 HipA N-terminal domain-containing protein [Rhizobium sp. CC-CFT758]